MLQEVFTFSKSLLPEVKFPLQEWRKKKKRKKERKRNPKSKEAALKETREKEMVAIDMLSFISQPWTEPGNPTLILWKVVLFAIQRKK